MLWSSSEQEFWYFLHHSARHSVRNQIYWWLETKKNLLYLGSSGAQLCWTLLSLTNTSLVFCHNSDHQHSRQSSKGVQWQSKQHRIYFLERYLLELWRSFLLPHKRCFRAVLLPPQSSVGSQCQGGRSWQWRTRAKSEREHAGETSTVLYKVMAIFFCFKHFSMFKFIGLFLLHLASFS